MFLLYAQRKCPASTTFYRAKRLGLEKASHCNNRTPMSSLDKFQTIFILKTDETNIADILESSNLVVGKSI